MIMRKERHIFKIPYFLIERLNEDSLKTGKTKSEILTEILECYFNEKYTVVK